MKYQPDTVFSCEKCTAKKDCMDYIHRKRIESTDTWPNRYTCKNWFGDITDQQLDELREKHGIIHLPPCAVCTVPEMWSGKGEHSCTNCDIKTIETHNRINLIRFLVAIESEETD